MHVSMIPHDVTKPSSTSQITFLSHSVTSQRICSYNYWNRQQLGWTAAFFFAWIWTILRCPSHLTSWFPNAFEITVKQPWWNRSEKLRQPCLGQNRLKKIDHKKSRLSFFRRLICKLKLLRRLHLSSFAFALPCKRMVSRSKPQPQCWLQRSSHLAKKQWRWRRRWSEASPMVP